MAWFPSPPILQVRVTTNPIDVTSDQWTPNERWTYTDIQGHEHRYVHGYPTLDEVIDESHWCDGTEGIARHDPHEAVDAAHYECKLCREVIEPKLDPPSTVKSIPGRIEATGEGTTSDGRHIQFTLSKDEYEMVVDNYGTLDDVAQQALIDAVPDERIFSWSSERQ